MLRTVIALLTSSVLLLAASPARAVTVFTATLTGSQEAIPNASTASGSGSFVLNDAMTQFSFTVTISGLDITGTQTPDNPFDDLFAAHIHAPALPGANGPVRFGFFGAPFNDTDGDAVVTPFGTGVGGIFTSEWDATEGNNTTLIAQIPSILAGLSYINFHTVQFPGGEIRGQILRTTEPTQVPEPTTLALLGAGLIACMGFDRLRRRRRL
jgi:hypothetical protein